MSNDSVGLINSILYNDSFAFCLLVFAFCLLVFVFWFSPFNLTAMGLGGEGSFRDVPYGHYNVLLFPFGVLRHTPYAIRHTPYAIRHTPYGIRNTFYLRSGRNND